MHKPLMAIEDAPILIVDDDATNRGILAALLRRGGFRQIACAENAATALAAIESRPPVCILLDVVMEGMDGFELCRRLRAEPRHARTAIIMQTALANPKDRRAAFAAGATDIVAKPFDLAEIEARVRVHVTSAVLSTGQAAYQAAMEAELGEARTLVETILPQPAVLTAAAACGVTLSHAYRPCSAVGGDYWTASVLEDGRIALVVGDVSGHGVSAALRMFALHTLVTPPPPFISDPSTLAGFLDARLYAYGHEQAQFVAGACGVIDAARGTFRFVGAGLPRGLLHRQGGGCDLVPLSGLPFGLAADLPRPMRTVALHPGDTLILYSDALVEGEAATGAPRSEDSLRDWMLPILADAPSSSTLAEWLALRYLGEFGHGVIDDLLIVAARITRPAPAEARDPSTPRQTIIALTANALAGDRHACLEAGMDDRLGKPVTREDIRQMLANHLRDGAPGQAAAGRPEPAAAPPPVSGSAPASSDAVPDVGGDGTRADGFGDATDDSAGPLPRKAGALHVLLAEDDPILQRITTAYLHQLGHGVTVVRNGRDAVEAVERKNVDLILMDLCMPKVSGFAATAAIRTRGDAKARIPIIALTGNTSAYDQDLCWVAGMDAYLAKPVSMEALARALSGYTGVAHHPAEGPGAAPQVPERISVGQLETLRQVLGTAKVRHLLDAYATSARASIARILAFLKAGDAVEVHTATHDLKSTSGNLGFSIVADLARIIDEAARAGDLERGHQLLPRLSHELDAVLAEVLSAEDAP